MDGVYEKVIICGLYAGDRIQRTDLFQQIFTRAKKLFMIYLAFNDSTRLYGQTEFFKHKNKYHMSRDMVKQMSI